MPQVSFPLKSYALSLKLAEVEIELSCLNWNWTVYIYIISPCLFDFASRCPHCSYEVWSCVCELGRHGWLTVCRWCQPHHLQYVFLEVDGERCPCHSCFAFCPVSLLLILILFPLYGPLLAPLSRYLSFYHLYLSLTNSLFLSDFSFLTMCHSYSVTEVLYFTLLTTTMAHLYV